MPIARGSFLLTIVALCGCGNIPGWENLPPVTTSATDAGASSSGGEDWATTSGDGILTTTIGVEPTSATGDTTEATGTTAAALDPVIVGQIVGPDPLELAGPIAVSVATEHADGVRMQVGDHAPVELGADGPNTYTGEILMLSALANGTHAATFTAWREGLESEDVVVLFDVALPKMGDEAFWESAALIGKGTIAALAATPSGDVLEFGTFYPANEARCYLRRRDLGGGWGDDDLVVVLPETSCTATDMKVSPAGEIFMLAQRVDNGDLRWTLGKQATWGGIVENIGQGAIGEDAHALAIHPEMVAVCGARPQLTDDLDAFAAIFRPNAPGQVQAFDYEKLGAEPHTFDETARDCVFVGDVLTLVGEAHGQHEGNGDPERDRIFVLELAANTLVPTWTVAPPGPGTQSGATAAVMDDQGRLLLTGYTCGDQCEAEGALRIFVPGEGLTWQVSLGLGVLAPRDVAWHPAGYLVVAGARQDSPFSTVFWAQGWAPDGNQPLWTAQHTDAPAFQFAVTVTVGVYGQVFAGGVGAMGYPAIAYING